MSPQELLDQQRAEQLLRDARLALELSKAYGGPWATMRQEILEVLAVVEKARLAGVTVDTAWLLRKGYLDRLEKVVTFQTRTYLDFTARKVSQASLASALHGQRNADELIAEVAPGDVPAPPASPAVANLQAGTPLRHLLDTLPGQVGSQAASALLEGILLGRGPREIARDIRKVAQIPLTRALTIARTETLRVYRQATLERFQKASTLTGWTWVAKLDDRTCPVCVALHGTVHALGEEMATHPNCRCAMAPLTEPWNTDVPETRFTPETGEAWFARQSPERQRAMLGPGKFALYQAGELKLADLVQPTVSPVWGRGVRERPLRELRPEPAAPSLTITVSDRVHETASEYFDNFSLYYARENGMSLDEYKAAVTSRLQREVDNSDIIIRTPVPAAVQIGRDGRFKSQFETDTSGGLLAPDVRERAEKLLFGYDSGLPVESRPIYGYLSASERESLDAYGEVRWILKGDVRERTTFTAADSLSAKHVPSPLSEASYLSSAADGHFDPLTAHASPPGTRHSGNEWPKYWEAQVHGGVRTSDVDRVELHVLESQTTDSPEVASLLDLEMQRAIDLAADLRSHGLTVNIKAVAHR